MTGDALIGPSLSFAEERMFVTIGAAYGRSEELEGDFYVGGPVPEEVTEVPTVEHSHWKLGVAMTYRFALGKKKGD